MKLSRLKNIIYFLHLGSFDICLGVVSLMLPLYFEVTSKPALAWFFILPSSVWLIYFFDHLLDSYKNKSIISLRHIFIQKNKPYFKILAAFIIIINTYLVTNFFEMAILLKSTWVIGLCLLYFLFNYFNLKWFIKELFAALIYSIGICFYPFLLNDTSVLTQNFIVIYCWQIFILAFINLLQITLRESIKDSELGLNNFANIIGNKTSTLLLVLLYILAAVTLYFFQSSIPFSVIIGFTGCYLIHLLHFTKIKNHQYRLISEFSFMLVGAMYLLGKA